VPINSVTVCIEDAMEQLQHRLATELREQISQGVYGAGERLPGVRTLSRMRGVSIATVLAAYRRLEDDALVEARPRSGYYVRSRPNMAVLPPAVSTPAAQPSPVSGQDLVLGLVKATHVDGLVQLGAAVPDACFLPTRAVERALARSARLHRSRLAAYEFPPGLPELRRQIARRMVQAGCAVDADEVVITNGCQEALVLALQAVTRPGDVVAIESPTFYGLLQALEALELEALEIPTDPVDGLSLEALQLALERWPVKVCVATPSFSNPLGYCMSPARKRRLLELLGRHRVPLIEDDLYGDLGFAAQRPPPCLSLVEGSGAEVIYCSSFSKTLSPGLRVGWILRWILPGRHKGRVEYLKYVLNLATPTVSQLALAELLGGGGYERHLRTVRGDYARALERMIEAVMRHFPPGTRITQPAGGFVIWVELAPDVDSLELARRARAEGISIAPGPIFSATQKYRNFMRLSCACPWDGRIEAALGRLAGLLDKAGVDLRLAD
jgi:DNA-binding transcriptional MocR family regulator